MEISGLLKLVEIKGKSRNGKIILYNCTYKGTHILVALIGMGEENSRAASVILKDIVDGYRVKQIVMVGFCGATDPQLNLGDIILFKKIKYLKTGRGEVTCEGYVGTGINRNLHYQKVTGATLNFLASSTSIKSEIYKRFGVQAVDMESYFICREALKHDVPFINLRVVSDTAEDDLPEFMVDFSKNRRLAGLFRALILAVNPRRAKRAVQAFKNIKLAGANLAGTLNQLVLD